MGGTGGGLVYNVEELKTIVARGLAASPVHEVLVEESILGWEELELEVVRDAKGQKITVCFIENIDPLGVHTGDSFCAAPMLDHRPRGAGAPSGEVLSGYGGRRGDRRLQRAVGPRP